MTRRFTPKRLPDSRAMLNIGCGWTMHWDWTNLDFSPYARLARNPTLARTLTGLGILNAERRERLSMIDPEIVYWDLRRGIPFEDATFDVVYHAHFLEHLDREVAPVVLRECARVLKPRGIIRIVVPDWEVLAHDYLKALKAWDDGSANASSVHAKAMYEMLDQMVRDTVTGAGNNGLRARLENWWRGGAAGTGELHRWMYDRRSLGELLEQCGFETPRQEAATTSRISGWAGFHLDQRQDGAERHHASLYLEGARPA